MQRLHITPGPDRIMRTGCEVSAVSCKRCRRRTVHLEVVLDDTAPSYYEPLLALQCKRCATVRTWLANPR